MSAEVKAAEKADEKAGQKVVPRAGQTADSSVQIVVVEWGSWMAARRVVDWASWMVEMTGSTMGDRKASMMEQFEVVRKVVQRETPPVV